MTTKSAPREMLIASVGESPQVVTLALDELLKRNFAIRRVLVIQPSEAMPKIKAALDKLREEASGYKKEHGITFEFCVFEGEDGYRPADTLDKRDTEAVLQTFNRELRAAKAAGWRVHLSIAGGRKVISAFGTVAAQLHFDSDDCCWHVIEGQQADYYAMHPAPGESVTLVEVPILSWKLWKRVIAGSLALALTDDPIQTERLLRHLEANIMQAQKLRDFYFQKLNYTEQRVLALLALKGLPNDELEEKLGCSIKNKITGIATKYNKFFKKQTDDRRLIAEFQQIMLALEFRGELPDLTPAGATKETRETYQAREIR